MPIKVFIVDDEPSIPKLIGIYLERMAEDFHVISAPTGAEALDIVSQMSEKDFPDITILDYKMDDMDGIETAKQLGEKGIQNIYLLSAYTDSEMIAKSKDCGIRGIMKKSEGFKAIAEKLAEIIRLAQEL
ncbi:MAG: response regulator [Candidatus Thorarchaeota archaeon]